MTDSGTAMMLIVLGLVLYFAPAIAGRKKRNSGAILALNLFLGWTVIGWIVALVWALTVDTRTPAGAVLEGNRKQCPF